VDKIWAKLKIEVTQQRTIIPQKEGLEENILSHFNLNSAKWDNTRWYGPGGPMQSRTFSL